MGARATRHITSVAVAWLVTASAGCGWHAWSGPPVDPSMLDQELALMPPNQIIVPAVDREFLWNQIVDTVDDYFQIEREERIAVIDGVITEGRLETYPLVAATLLEPWRRDSAPGFERWQSTLQSMRRRALVRVSPGADGYIVEITVLKELEDVDRPARATVGVAALRHEGGIVRFRDHADEGPVTLGWIPQGRDVALEQRILSQIQGRLSVNVPPGFLPSNAG